MFNDLSHHENHVENSLLGQSTEYPQQYSPSVLYPIARSLGREHIAHAEQIQGLQQGTDWWHVFELSWLNPQGIPQVAIGRLHIPAESPYLIESKSLKLYFNSFNFEQMNREKLIATVEDDLSYVAAAQVKLELFDANQLDISQAMGQCLDQLQPSQIEYQPNATLLQFNDNATHGKFYYHSHLLRSNCPVTSQPDWGTVFIRYQGQAVCEPSLLAYIISYRQHNGFHEQCVEQMYADIWTQLKPEKLMVYAAYTRRGGLDINPCRVSHLDWLPQPVRLARQ
ncbi:NADPH-dependent 7-cyano-7-deazaguanine reductase QueF [Acinetobacter sp. c1-l78]|uniref:NADPH-dependent 7-cyano-7-deazaguanine reductase QueF n=1 Tax=Acinetobacter sp. c1-l78 TaxID=3342803 RepID=UPI0035B8A7FD